MLPAAAEPIWKNPEAEVLIVLTSDLREQMIEAGARFFGGFGGFHSCNLCRLEAWRAVPPGARRLRSYSPNQIGEDDLINALRKAEKCVSE